MLGKQERWQEDLFVVGSLRDLIPEDHILRRVDRVLDLSWLREEVRELYDEWRGRPSVDPEAAVRLMLAGFFQGITQDRKLMREAQVNLAIRWFAGYRLQEKLPDHSSLTRIRQRWGAQRFKAILQRTVEQCVRAGLVGGETVHFDATLIRADVSWSSLVERHAERVLEDNEPADRPGVPDGGANDARSRPVGGASAAKRKVKKISRTDPEASLATSSRDYHLEPSYKQHTAVDDRAGVVLDVKVTTGERSEGKELLGQLGRVEQATGRKVETTTADAAYAHTDNYLALEDRGIEAIIPPAKETVRRGRMPLSRFKYDAKHGVVRCPAGKVLRRVRRDAGGEWYQAEERDCARCRLRRRCFAPSMKRRMVRIVRGYEALLRARRRRWRWGEREKERYQRHRWRVEGIHGEAKTQHGLRRAARRGLWNVAIQAYLTAAVMNLKRLAALLFVLVCGLAGKLCRRGWAGCTSERRHHSATPSSRRRTDP